MTYRLMYLNGDTFSNYKKSVLSPVKFYCFVLQFGMIAPEISQHDNDVFNDYYSAYVTVCKRRYS